MERETNAIQYAIESRLLHNDSRGIRNEAHQDKEKGESTSRGEEEMDGRIIL